MDVWVLKHTVGLSGQGAEFMSQEEVREKTQDFHPATVRGEFCATPLSRVFVSQENYIREPLF